MVEKLEAVRSEAGVFRAFVDGLVEQGVQENNLRDLQEWQRLQAQLAFEDIGSLASVEPKPSVPERRRAEDDDSPSPQLDLGVIFTFILLIKHILSPTALSERIGVGK